MYLNFSTVPVFIFPLFYCLTMVVLVLKCIMVLDLLSADLLKCMTLLENIRGRCLLEANRPSCKHVLSF